MFKAGFSTASEVNDDAGRGVGMDVIVSRVQQLHGNIKINSRRGKACQFTITLPQSTCETEAA